MTRSRLIGRRGENPTARADSAGAGDKACTLYVGVADDQLIWATTGTAFTEVSACSVARRAASAMLSNLPPLR